MKTKWGQYKEMDLKSSWKGNVVSDPWMDRRWEMWHKQISAVLIAGGEMRDVGDIRV